MGSGWVDAILVNTTAATTMLAVPKTIAAHFLKRYQPGADDWKPGHGDRVTPSCHWAGRHAFKQHGCNDADTKKYRHVLSARQQYPIAVSRCHGRNPECDKEDGYISKRRLRAG